MSLSKAALASASRRACCELRDVSARSFSARKRSSGLWCFIVWVRYAKARLPKFTSAEPGQGEGLQVNPGAAVQQQLGSDLANGARELEAVT
jgi:hypothetical protein